MPGSSFEQSAKIAFFAADHDANFVAVNHGADFHIAERRGVQPNPHFRLRSVRLTNLRAFGPGLRLALPGKSPLDGAAILKLRGLPDAVADHCYPICVRSQEMRGRSGRCTGLSTSDLKRGIGQSDGGRRECCWRISRSLPAAPGPEDPFGG